MRTDLIDPQDKYYAEGFTEQPQEWPGLQRDMDPVPDCGEVSYEGTGRLKGRHALVTGGDSGIGRAAAIAFAREGAKVAINYHPKEQSDADDLSQVLTRDGIELVQLPGDLTDEEFCLQLVDDAKEKLGGLDLLVINAGYQQARKSIAEITHEQFDRTMKTNIYAMFWMSKRAACDHQHRQRQQLQSGRRSSRLCDNEGRNRDLYQGTCQTARIEGCSGECNRPRPGLDATADFRRTTGRQDRKVRSGHAAWAGRAARRTCRTLCNAGRANQQLHDRQRLWGKWRDRSQLTIHRGRRDMRATSKAQHWPRNGATNLHRA